MADSTLNGGQKIAKLSRDAEIVITGMSGKFPNSQSVKEYIDNLLNKVDLCDDKVRYGNFDNPEIPKILGKVPDIEKFDVGYFGIHSKHAYYTDPMSRLLHEQVIGALFDAGIHPEELKGTKTGVFVGSCVSEYDLLLFNIDGSENKAVVANSNKSMTAIKISYHLQVNGPSFNTDTACSSSMYALREAYESILYGRCDRAIVAGCNLCLEQNSTLQFARLGVLNPGTGCRPFDNNAQGYTRGEGVAVVILQKRVEAKRIYASIVHVNTNSDGFKSNGITFPSSEGQLALMIDTYQQAQLSPKDIGFLEAHGTGTKIGDPEELDAVDKFFNPTIAEPLLLGSVKGNIGHTEPVAALCSLVKVLYALYYEKIPPNIHFSQPKEGIAALREKRLMVVTEVTPFPPQSSFAGINSFGFGGANGHLIIKKINQENIKDIVQSHHLRLVCYSGRTQTAIDELHGQISDCLDIEYLRLIQDYFKNHFDQHFYRGFTIVGSNIRSYLQLDQFYPTNAGLLVDMSGDLKNVDDLLKIPLLNSISKEVRSALGSCNEIANSVLMQLVLLKMFKMLKFVPELIAQDGIFSKYFNDEINFKELIACCTNNTTKSRHNMKQAIEKWIKSNSIYGRKSTIVICGNSNLCLDISLSQKCNLIHFNGKMTTIDLLCNIGRLYEAGYTLQVQKLNVDIKFPVRNGTKMLSHLIRWKQKFLSIPKWRNEYIYKGEVIKYIRNKFYTGHLIHNRNLFPATGYLYQVWILYAKQNRNHHNKLDIVFEDVKFHRTCTYSDEGITLCIVVQDDGNFEVSENAATIVTGNIRRYNEANEGVEEYVVDDFDHQLCIEDTYVLSSKDAYRELRLRGYNYKGLFRAIHRVSPKLAEIKWDNRWVTFLDNMMQAAILQEDSRELFVPVGIERLVVRASKHIDYVNEIDDRLVPMNYSKETKTILSKYIEMTGLQARSISMKKDRMLPVLESYQFIPNEYVTDLTTSMRINIQILLECKQTINFRVIEVLALDQNVLIEYVCNVIEDLPQVLPDLTVVTSKENFTIKNVNILQDITEQNVLFICQSPHEDLIRKADKALLPDGFILCLCTSEYVFTDKYTLITKHALSDERIAYFLRKSSPKSKNPVLYDISDTDELKWVKNVQDACKKHEDLVLFAQNNYKNGILGLTNCLIKEPDTTNIRCLFIQDATDIFDPHNNDLLNQQLKKHMPINVYKNGQWGTYRHIRLPNLDEISAFHWYANTDKLGDLSSLKWIRGPSTDQKNAIAKIAYSGLNFRDLMLASGKLSLESVNIDRSFRDYIQGLEYSGQSLSGKRICGLGLSCISNWMYNSLLIVDIPDDMSLEDAATIAVVYCTVLYALLITVKIRKGQSILIHSGTGGVGLAALNVCTYFECDIFVTVGTQAKRDYILNNYPHINPNHIGNSRNTSFKYMVLRETKGCGVDIILNSLAQEKLQASVDCLAVGGNFVEIGKYDMDKNSSLFVDLTMKCANYWSIMLDKAVAETNSKLPKILTQLLHEGLKKGYIKPLPRTVFQIDELEKAFRYLGTGKHIGKVLIRIDHEKDHKVLPRFYCDPTRSYIIFGGLGGFGLELADWLVLRGAKHIILSSRKGITTGYQRYRIGIWRSYGVNITILIEDVTDYNVCYAAIKTINSTCHVDGIFNLAVVLKDAIWKHQTIDTMRTSMAPKAILTDHLDKITRELCHHLRYFVVFSSVSCGRGNGGQSNYGFSNSIMERICEMRHADNLPSLAIQWGAVGDVGILEELQKEHDEIAIGGTLQQKVLNCLTVLDQLILQSRPIVSSIVVAEKFNKGIANTSIEAVCMILGLKDRKNIPKYTLLPELGMDSMMAAEIKQTLERDFHILLTPNELRNLTFAKLEDISGETVTSPKADEISTADLLASLSPRLQLVQLNKGLIDFNSELSKSKGDFVLTFPGIDAGLDIFETISNVINRHVKCAYYDGISNDQSNVDVIVDYIFTALCDDILQKRTFNIIAHSVGCLAAIELTKRFEDINIRGKLILIDAAPELIFQLLKQMKADKTDEEFECSIIENMVFGSVPNHTMGNVREVIKNGNNLGERIEVMCNYCINGTREFKSQIKSLAHSFVTRLYSVYEYKKREKYNKMRSKVVLYKPTQLLIYTSYTAEDYNLSMIFETVGTIRTFDGNHMTMLINNQLQLQLLKDLG